LGILIAWVFRIGAEAAGLEKSALAASVFVVSVLFAGILTGERSFAVEQQNDCISGLLLSPVDAGDIYLGKLLVNIAVLCVFEIVSLPVVLVLFGVNPAANLLWLILIIMLLNIGIAAAGTFLASVSAGARSHQSLLSVLMMAVLCPVIIPAVSAMLYIFGSQISDINLGRAAGFLAAFDAIFVTIAWLLFATVIAAED
jgi:heme exporter protein B